MTTDTGLQRDVLNELRSEPTVDATRIGVTARDGVVTLAGAVPTYAQKVAVEAAAKRVYGVRAVADELEVRLRSEDQRDDADIACAAADALRWHAMVPDDRITVTVDNGWVMLEGNVDWQCQKYAAEQAVRRLIGVTAVMNAIRVKAHMSPSDVKRKVFDAFRRSAELEAWRIGVDVHDGKLTLHGNVHTWAQVQEGQRAAWCVPGVTEVDNRVKVVPCDRSGPIARATRWAGRRRRSGAGVSGGR